MTALRLFVAAIAVLASLGAADAQFYWPWQQQPAARPQPQAPVTRPREPREPRTIRRDAPERRTTTRPAADPKEAKGDPKAAEAKPAPEVPEGPPPLYEPQLLRLSEVLGALAFLRPLCGGQDESEWRNRMNALIEAEQPGKTRRERLAGAYNKGYRGFAQTYRRCTPAAETLIARYLDEGGRLSRELASRYGG